MNIKKSENSNQNTTIRRAVASTLSPSIRRSRPRPNSLAPSDQTPNPQKPRYPFRQIPQTHQISNHHQWRTISKPSPPRTHLNPPLLLLLSTTFSNNNSNSFRCSGLISDRKSNMSTISKTISFPLLASKKS